MTKRRCGYCSRVSNQRDYHSKEEHEEGCPGSKFDSGGSFYIWDGAMLIAYMVGRNAALRGLREIRDISDNVLKEQAENLASLELGFEMVHSGSKPLST